MSPMTTRGCESWCCSCADVRREWRTSTLNASLFLKFFFCRRASSCYGHALAVMPNTRPNVRQRRRHLFPSDEVSKCRGSSPGLARTRRASLERCRRVVGTFILDQGTLNPEQDTATPTTRPNTMHSHICGNHNLKRITGKGKKRNKSTPQADNSSHGGNSVWAGHTQVKKGDRRSQCLTLNSEALPPVWSSEPFEFFGNRLQTLMARATVEDSTASQGQTFSRRRPLVGGLPFHDVSGLHEFKAHSLPGGIQVQGR